MQFGRSCSNRCSRWALITRCEDTEGVNLLNEVGDASPSTPANADHNNPYHNEYVDEVDSSPTGQKEGRLLNRILAGCCTAVHDHVSDTGDDVDGESNQKGSNGGVNGSEEWECNGEEPHW